jgi:hypothetical protein
MVHFLNQIYLKFSWLQNLIFARNWQFNLIPLLTFIFPSTLSYMFVVESLDIMLSLKNNLLEMLSTKQYWIG